MIVRPGPANDAVFLGLQATDGAAFDRVAARLRDAGCELAPASEAEIAERRVERMAHTGAPWGVRVELVQGLEEAAEPYVSPSVPGGFLTRSVGFGHAVFATTAFEESHRFLTAGLGFAQSDWIETEIAAGIELEVRFYHWQAEAYDEGWSGVDRSEDDWDEAGKRLATRLEAETGQPVEYVP